LTNQTDTCRVLHVVTMLYSGGVERWLVDLCPAGRSHSLSMDIAVLQVVDGLFAQRARELNINVFHCPAPNPYSFISNLRRILRTHGPYDAVHAHVHAFSSFALIAASLEGIPARLVHSHNVMCNSGFVRTTYVHFARLLIRKFATAILSPSPEALADLMGKTWRTTSRCRVMPCGIDLSPFRIETNRNALREAFGIPPGAFVLGSVGRLTWEKNSEFLVDVLGEMLKLSPNTYLVAIGEGPLRSKMEAKAQAGGFRDKLILPGTRPDVPSIIRGLFDVFLFPSVPPPLGNEAWAIAVVEAQAAGLPTLMSEGLPDAAILVPELVTRLQLNEGGRVWAETAARCARKRTPEAAARALSILERSDFSVVQNIGTLSKLYRNPNYILEWGQEAAPRQQKAWT
jgi:glycosyltransferase involved in cell wall biosynthesis